MDDDPIIVLNLYSVKKKDQIEENYVFVFLKDNKVMYGIN